MFQRSHIYASIFVFGVSIAPLGYAQSLVSVTGSSYSPGVLPLTIEQEGRTANNIAITLEREGLADSVISQQGKYNRSAQIQMGGDKYVDLYQMGDFNRGLIVQVGSSETDIHQNNVQQTGIVNNLYTYQISANPDERDEVEAAWASLDLAQAQDVARNFIFGPELSRAKLGIAQDISRQFTNALSLKLGKKYLTSEWGSSSPLFVDVNYGDVDRANALGVVGYSQHIRGLTLGTRYALNQNNTLGLSFNYSNAKAWLNHDMGSVKTDAYQVAGFGSHRKGDFGIDWVLGWGRMNFESFRAHDALSIHAKSRGDVYTGHLQAAYFFNNKKESVYWGPFASLGYQHSSTKAYTENGHVLMAQSFGKETRHNLKGSVGGFWIFNAGEHAGRVVSSEIRAEWVYDAEIKAPKQASSQFLFNRANTISTPLMGKGHEEYGVLSASLKMPLAKNFDVVLTGQKIFGSGHLKSSAAYVGLNWIF